MATHQYPTLTDQFVVPYGCSVHPSANTGEGPTASADSEEKPLLGSTELFFSITDRRGIIRTGNSVFARVSGYGLDELAGKPHSVVRHPEMPGGLFHLMWEELASGRPVGAFVKNRAKNGSAYWVFATMSPVPDGYVSVRLAPCSHYSGVAELLYAQVRGLEHDARNAGNDRHASAAIGRAELEEALRQQGFDSYTQFMHESLPAEIAARTLTTASLRSNASGPISTVLSGATWVDEILTGMVGRLDAYQEMCGRLTTAAERILDIIHRINHSIEAVRDSSEQVADQHPVLLNIARVMTFPMSDAVRALQSLQLEMVRLRSSVTELQFRISLAALFNSMVAAFAAEVIDGTAPAHTLKAVPLLCDATTNGLLDMAAMARQVNEQRATVAQLAEQARKALDRFQHFLGQWRLRVLRYNAGSKIGEKLSPVDAELAVSWQWLELLHDLIQQFRSGTTVFDFAAVESHLAQIKSAANEYATS